MAIPLYGLELQGQVAHQRVARATANGRKREMMSCLTHWRGKTHDDVKPIVGGLLTPVMVKWFPIQQLLMADYTLETEVPDGIPIVWAEVNIDLGNIVECISGNVYTHWQRNVPPTW